jgi:hypothetical protein
MAEKVFRGRTEDAELPFLSAEFWKAGLKVVGVVKDVFMAGEQKCYALELVTPVTLDEEEVDRVAIGSMAGLRMAFQAARLNGLCVGDRVVLECTGKTPSKKPENSARVNFDIEVGRATSAF